MTEPPITRDAQIALFHAAVVMLGGNRDAARALDCGESTIRQLCTGGRSLHKGWLAQMSKALLDHAEAARTLERQLNPLFHGNLTEEQRDG